MEEFRVDFFGNAKYHILKISHREQTNHKLFDFALLLFRLRVTNASGHIVYSYILLYTRLFFWILTLCCEFFFLNLWKLKIELGFCNALIQLPVARAYFNENMAGRHGFAQFFSRDKVKVKGTTTPLYNTHKQSIYNCWSYRHYIQM